MSGLRWGECLVCGGGVGVGVSDLGVVSLSGLREVSGLRGNVWSAWVSSVRGVSGLRVRRQTPSKIATAAVGVHPTGMHSDMIETYLNEQRA